MWYAALHHDRVHSIAEMVHSASSARFGQGSQDRTPTRDVSDEVLLAADVRVC